MVTSTRDSIIMKGKFHGSVILSSLTSTLKKWKKHSSFYLLQHLESSFWENNTQRPCLPGGNGVGFRHIQENLAKNLLEQYGKSTVPMCPKCQCHSLPSFYCYTIQMLEAAQYSVHKHIQLYVYIYWGFPGDSVQKNPPVNAGAWVQPLDQEEPLQKEMASHSSILAWEILWKRSLAGYSPWGCKELDVT